MITTELWIYAKKGLGIKERAQTRFHDFTFSCVLRFSWVALILLVFYPTYARAPLFVGQVKLGEVHQPWSERVHLDLLEMTLRVAQAQVYAGLGNTEHIDEM